MVEGRRDYTQEEVDVARAVLVELGHILAEFWQGIVVVGGWVPYFTVPQEHTPHEGSKDVDLALNPGRLGKGHYNTIGEILIQSLYQQDLKKPFRYYRKLTVEGETKTVIVDFLTGENEGDAKDGQIQEIQDVMASTIHGCDIAFLDPIEQVFAGVYPDGGRDEVTIRVASVQAFLIMKGFALHNRGGDNGRKDAYDIYYSIKHFSGGIEGIVARFIPHLTNALVQEGLRKIAGKFASIDHVGPRFVADRGEDEEERAFLQRDAYEQVQALLERLGVLKSESMSV